MRVIIAAIAAIGALAAPALAQQTLAEQVANARQTFMAGLDAEAFREGGYYAVLTEGLGGTYVELSGMIDQADAAGIRRQQDALCAQNPFTITVTPPFGLFITRGADEKIQYTYTGGATFIPALDVIGYARANPGARGSLATDLLKRVAEPVSIWRPSRDVMVITGRDVPDVFVRCGRSPTSTQTKPDLPPVQTSAPPDEGAPGALEIALGETFDGMFASAAPDARAAFIACAAPAFAPLAPEDLKVVIETGFVPPEDVRKRIEAANPDLTGSLAACAEAARTSVE